MFRANIFDNGTECGRSICHVGMSWIIESIINDVDSDKVIIVTVVAINNNSNVSDNSVGVIDATQSEEVAIDTIEHRSSIFSKRCQKKLDIVRMF